MCERSVKGEECMLTHPVPYANTVVIDNSIMHDRCSVQTIDFNY
jgi:hypothetical protein